MSIFNKKNITEDPVMAEPVAEDQLDDSQVYEPLSNDQQEQEGPEAADEAVLSGSDGRGSFFSGENLMMLMSLLLAVILLFAGGFLLYKTHALSVDNSKLEKRVQRDTKLKKSEAEYEAETENLQAETDTLINRYGAGNTPEKTIMFLANMSSSTGIAVTSIEFGDSENVTVDEDGHRLSGAIEAPDPNAEESSSDQEDTKEAGNGEYYLYKYQATISYTGTYSELKKAIDFIEDYGERTTVNDITATYDDTTKKLTGSMTLNMYTLSGTEQEYTAPSVNGSLGNANIFG